MHFPALILQIDDAPESWPRFLYKASVGSYKAADMVEYAEYALMEQVGPGRLFETASEEEYNAVIEGLIVPKPGERLQAPLTSELAGLCQLQESLVLNASPYHHHGSYQGLYARGVAVDRLHLLHDALHAVWSSWSPATYLRLRGRIAQDSMDYNAQDVVAAMIMLTLGWPATAD